MRSLFAYIIFLVSLAILVSLSILYTQRFRSLTHHTNQVESTYQVIVELNKLFSYLKDAETGSRGFLLSGDSTFLVPYLTALDSMKPSFKKVYMLAEGSPEIKTRLDALNILIYERLDIIKHGMILYPSARPDFIKVLNRGREKMDECRTMISLINQDMNVALMESQKSKAFYELVTPGFFLIIMGFTAIAFVVSFYVIIREYTERLRYQKTLEKKIVALNTSNQELEQIAYITSHDLQEPLRKISIFCDLLNSKYANHLDDEGNVLISKIFQSSARTRELVDTVSNYTSLVIDGKPKHRVDLEKCIQTTAEKFRAPLTSKDTTIEATGLRGLKGYEDQVQLLLECLIDNSVKFSRQAIPLRITIAQEKPTREEIEMVRAHTAHHAFTKIVYRDNGIGFDNAFAEKMFSIFQRLQVDQTGKGVGLAIVKRVMSNHNGFVVADGKLNEGATFTLYFPEDDE